MHWLKLSLASALVASLTGCPADDTDPEGSAEGSGTEADTDETTGETTAEATGETGSGSTSESGTSVGSTSSTSSSSGSSDTEQTSSTTDDETTTGFCENFLPPIGPKTLPTAVVNEDYMVTFELGGELSPAGITWSVDGGPDTLILDAELGTLSGTVPDSGPYTLSVTAAVTEPNETCPTVPSSQTYELDIVEA